MNWAASGQPVRAASIRAMRLSGRSDKLIGKRSEGRGCFRRHCRETPRSTAPGCQTLPVGRGVS
ncbi:hypothetical protein [Paenibacillus durus]|uniref:hypothetical protein n=1 Tax=Paenibacillus durus TaxID=44251 RepID=UPI0011875742|nr:hypothetical protein [Paenibacillus durus]